MELTNDIRSLLEEVANDYEDAGCDGCGTISVETINKVRKALGWEPLGDEGEDDGD
jgi:hypothetical protein